MEFLFTEYFILFYIYIYFWLQKKRVTVPWSKLRRCISVIKLFFLFSDLRNGKVFMQLFEHIEPGVVDQDCVAKPTTIKASEFICCCTIVANPCISLCVSIFCQRRKWTLFATATMSLNWLGIRKSVWSVLMEKILLTGTRRLIYHWPGNLWEGKRLVIYGIY